MTNYTDPRLENEIELRPAPMVPNWDVSVVTFEDVDNLRPRHHDRQVLCQNSSRAALSDPLVGRQGKLRNWLLVMVATSGMATPPGPALKSVAMSRPAGVDDIGSNGRRT